ncbi:hypothetical protein R0131_10740 [Clostridium sp. AL.422]|uniref:hypothetical protein n=1 Tax=Clostridium TaxID=1485 RepID=UPI00293DDD66|nr:MULTISPECIES: hypothetical protein [unclassified Clostridium]MDV4151319.1 hypothetical protein [Clostridium sp. AL.422]
MKGKKKFLGMALGAICAMTLIGGSAYAMEYSGVDSEIKEPTVATTGDGESYTREELAEKLGITPEELDAKVVRYEFKLTEASKTSGRVENGVLISQEVTKITDEK